MRSRTDLLGELRQSDGTADSLKIALGFQLLGYRQKIQGDVFIVKRTHRLKYHPVSFAIEAARRELIHSFIDTIRLDQECTEDSLFHVKSLRRSVTHLKPKRIKIDRRILLPDRGPSFSLVSHRICYSKSGFTRILPQYSQTIIFLLEAMSISL